MRRPVPVLLSVALVSAALAVPQAAAAAPAPRRAPSPAAYLRTHGLHPAPAARTAPTAPVHLPRGLDPQAVTQPAIRGMVRVAVSGDPAAVGRAVRQLGGRTLATAASTSSVLLPKGQLRALAGAPGVSAVDAPKRPYALAAGPSEGVAKSGADAWHTAGRTGAGMQIAIVDLGFGSSATEYNDAVAAGELGTSPQLVNEDCADGNNSATPYVDAHGLAVAELAHQEAPDAQLVMYCIGDNIGLVNAAAAIEAANIRIASSSLGWYADSRGDGTGPVNSAAAVVAQARKAGILWIQSAGNDAASHWGRTMGDSDRDHYLDINGPYNDTTGVYEDDFIYVAPGSAQAPSAAAVYLQWDQWPTTTTPVSLRLYGMQCRGPFDGTGTDGCDAVPINPDGNGRPRPVTADHASGTEPTLAVDTSTFANTSQYDQIWEVVVYSSATLPTVRYDFNYVGDVDGPSDDACPSVTNNICDLPYAAYSESVTAPANSPYALAVGAAGATQTITGGPAGSLEYFSSQGPTIDRRVKPDITGWDGVSSYVPEFVNGFYGTSAAAPQVAGAAALVAADQPTWDAAQIQAYLEQHANDGLATNTGNPYNPPRNDFGHGLSRLGAPADVAAPPGSKYTSIAPKRILDTRSAYPPAGNKGAVQPGGTVTVAVSPDVPADATAVAVNLTGVGAKGKTFLAAYTGGTAWPGTSNLNQSQYDSTAAVFAVVSIDAAHRSITVRNSSSTVDVLVDEVGWFGTGASETGAYTSFGTPQRVLDTRTTLGGHQGKVTATRPALVDPALPADATAAIVNLTAVGASGGGHLTAAPACSGATSTLNFGRYTRANLAIVALDQNGRFCVTDAVNGVDVLVDVLGYMGDTGASYYALPSATRIVDTRYGNGGNAAGRSPRAIGPAASADFYGANVGDVPASATALLTGVLEASSTGSGHLTVYPAGASPASSSTLNFTSGRVVSNAAIVGLGTGGHAHRFGIYNSSGYTHAGADLFGYFA